jgi:hypothetical protein
MVNTRAEAEAVVRACRYYPLGSRSSAGVRGEWGEFKNYRDYLDTVNNGLVIAPMIETKPVAGESRCHRLDPGRRRPADRPVRPFDRAGGAA